MAQKAKRKAEPTGFQMSLLFLEDQLRLAKYSVIHACKGKRVAFDVETTGLEWWRDELIGLGVYCPDADVHHYIPVTSDAERAEVKDALQEIAHDPETTLWAHNLKFDAHFMDIELWNVPCGIGDTAVGAHLQDSRWQKSLGALEQRFLHTSTKKELLGEGGGSKIKDMPLGNTAEYCINDARITYELMLLFLPILAELRLTKLYEMEMRHYRVLQQIERRGMLLDVAFCNRAIARFSHNLELMEADLLGKITALAASNGLPDPLDKNVLGKLLYDQAVRQAKRKGKSTDKIKIHAESFNWRSDDQLSAVVYDGCGIERPVNPFADADGVDRTRFAQRGKYNATMTSSFLLMEKANHPLGPLLMDMREALKLRETLLKWLELRDKDNRIHTSLNPTGTRTGRLSSSDPNLQNVAGKERVRDTQSVYSGSTIREDEYNLRQGLIAAPGSVFLSLDHKQQEGRLFAVISQDPDMIAAVKAREDIHGLVARMVWAEDLARDPNLYPIRREWAKTLAFGMLYGLTKGSMQHRLNKTPAEAEAIFQAYQGRFKRVMPFLQETVALLKQHKFLRYWSGRIWREEHPDYMYKGTNAQVQGGGSDLMRLATLRIQKWLLSSGAGQLVDIIHDELLCEVKIEWLVSANRIGLKIMELEDVLGIPFLADSKCGYSYGTLMPLEKFIEQEVAAGIDKSVFTEHADVSKHEFNGAKA